MTAKKVLSEILKNLENNELKPDLIEKQEQIFHLLAEKKYLKSLQKKWPAVFTGKIDDLEKKVLYALLADLIRRNEDYHTRIDEITNVYEDVVGLVTHEFKNILTSVHGYNMILERELAGRDDDSRLKNLQASDRLTRQLFDMTDSLLKMSLSEKGLLKPEYKLIHFAEDIIEPIQADLAGEQADKQMKIVTEKPAGDLIIEGDDGLLDIVMRNLLINALKYGKRGTVITVTVVRKNKHLGVRVKNECNALPQNFCKDIFRKFTKKQIGEVKGGSGIGLYNVQKIIHLHGGEISCKVEQKKWIVFEFQIPQNIF